MNTTHTETRSHRHEVVLPAAAEAVWRAITEPEELKRWFPLDARVTPGAGGRIELAWGPELINVCRVEAWEPGQRLRTNWAEPARAADATPCRPTHVDWTLEARGGTTLLRLVHSGFEHGADWDAEFDGTRSGWDCMLAMLRHYLQHHAGRARRVVWLRYPVSGTRAAAWQRWCGPGGLFRDGLPGNAAPGTATELVTAAGERLEAVPLRLSPPAELVLALPREGQAVAHVIAHEACFGQPESHLWISTWGTSQAEAEDAARRWRTLAERIIA